MSRISGLQRLLEDHERLPNGSTLVCSGSGLKILPPLTLHGRQLRIRFEQQPGSPLTIRPAAETEHAALFALTNSRLDLVNANLELPSSSRRKYPNSLFRLNSQSELLLDRCQLKGAEDSNPLNALIESAAAEKASAILLENCVAYSAGPLLRSPLQNRIVELSNTLVVSQADGFVLSGGMAAENLLLHHCTISAAGSVISWETLPESESASLFARNTVFAPPWKPSDSSCLLSIDDRRSIGTNLQWWESGCGYANQITSLLADEQSTETDPSKWSRLWGPAHVVDALAGPQAILLEQVIPEWKELNPQIFLLNSNCMAATWGWHGGPIGIDATGIGPDLTPPHVEEPENNPQRRPGSVPRRNKLPDF